LSRNALPFYKRYPRDLIEGTLGMPFEEKVTYAFVLDLIYLQQGNLPDDSRYIAGLLGVSVRKWNSLREKLIERGKIQVIGEFLTNYRAVIELESLGKYQDKQAENRSGASKNKELVKPASNHARVNQNQNQNSSSSAREAHDDPSSWDDDRLLSEVMAAVGIRDRVPAHWMPPAATIHVGRWRRDLKLPCLSIVDAAKQSRARHDEPPNGPKALDGVMRNLAGQLSASPMQPGTSGARAARPDERARKIEQWNKIAGGSQ